MGTGGSFLRNPDDDDIMGGDCDGASRGVIKRIPIEMKPRGKLMGLRSVGSLGKKQPKGGSLQSALSVDIENPEVERIKRDFEMYRLNKENEIANLQKKDKKLEMENKRLRGELLALQKTCSKLRAERDAAMETEQQAFARSAAFESDRDKVQRQFKIFRETKESEIQNLLRSKRQIENRLTRLSQGYVPEDSETVSRVGLDSTLGNHGDWWMTLDSEPSLGSTLQLHKPNFRGPEFANSVVELDGPFINVNKDDWSVALSKLSHIVPTVPDNIRCHMIRLYVSAPRDMHHEVDLIAKEYMPKLETMCKLRGRFLITVYLSSDDHDMPDNDKKELVVDARRAQVQMCTVFLAFLGEHTNRHTRLEFCTGHLDKPGIRPAVFCFRDPSYKGCKPSQGEAKELKVKVSESFGAKVINGYTSPSNGANLAYSELCQILNTELGVDETTQDTSDDQRYVEQTTTSYIQQLSGIHLWDPLQDIGQLEAFSHALSSSCQLAFEKYYERLNTHISCAGPLPPLLVLGQPGSGKSLLLAKWLQLQQEKVSGCLVLYHFVGRKSSVSADPLFMIRRLTAQLMEHISSPNQITSDSTRLIEEIPQWLEKVSSKSPGGAILVLDSIDRFTDAEVHLQWLLDPLPVDLRVIVSASEDNCPQTWQSWPSLRMEPLSNKNVKELLHAELASLDKEVSSEDETHILTHCRTDATCYPLYVMVLARSLSLGYSTESGDKSHLDSILSTTDCVGLYKTVLGSICQTYETPRTHNLVKKVLRYLVLSRNGLTEHEILSLVGGLTWNSWAVISHTLIHQLVFTFRSGLITFAHEEAEKAAQEKYLCDKSDLSMQLREDCIEYFSTFLHPSEVTFRVADELPRFLHQSNHTESLHNCLLNLSIFQQIYSCRRCDELLTYWGHVGIDRHSMAQLYFMAIKKVEENIEDVEGVTLPRIADLYEILGKFLKDLGHLSEALPSMQRALELREIALDPDHPAVAQSLHQLAGLHTQWGKFLAAENLYKQSLEIYKNALGEECQLVAFELEALAVLYQKQDKHDLAEPLRRRAMLIRKKNKSSAITLTHNRIQEPLRRRALQLEELTLSKDSPELARTLNELGVLYYLQNNVTLAESFFKRSLEMRESSLGPEHPDLAQSLNNLAALYNDSKQYDKAEPLYERALQIRTKNFSADHSSVAAIVRHLAMLYKKQGNWLKAEPLYWQVVEIREKSFGHKHPAVATALVNLAVLYSQRSNYKDAEPLYTRALHIYEESFGETHPRVSETLRNLAVMKYEQNDYETAARYYKKATEIRDADDKAITLHSSSVGSNATLKNMLRS